MIPAQLLTQTSLTYVGDRIYRQILVEHRDHRDPKLPEIKPVIEDPTGMVLWDYLLETGTLPVLLGTTAMYTKQSEPVHRWFMLDAIWSAVACHTWDEPVYRGSKKAEARRLMGILLSPLYENRTPFVGSHAPVNAARYGCQEGFQLLKLAEHFYIQQLTVFGHACAAVCSERPYDKAIMAYTALSSRNHASRARRRFNLLLQLHASLPDPWDVAVAQGIFRRP